MSDPLRQLARIAICCSAILSVILPDTAHAADCRIKIKRVRFGTYMPLTPTHVDVIGQISIKCKGRPGSFAVLIGPGISGDQQARTLAAGGANILHYNLFRDPARTEIWGDGTPPTFVVTGVRRKGRRAKKFNYSIYGRIFANQAPNSGRYTDAPIATVLF